MSRLKNRQVVVGFAAETHDLEAEARRKLKEKNLDFIVANDVTRKDAGFAVDTTGDHPEPDEKPERLPLLSKKKLAELILDRVAALLEVRGGDSAGWHRLVEACRWLRASDAWAR
jgi:phosphopantothenoylcysteine decarboxylase/phosphopantothenate--cysteine ligase